jgi:hypothetical protein
MRGPCRIPGSALHCCWHAYWVVHGHGRRVVLSRLTTVREVGCWHGPDGRHVSTEAGGAGAVALILFVRVDDAKLDGADSQNRTSSQLVRALWPKQLCCFDSCVW